MEPQDPAFALTDTEQLMAGSAAGVVDDLGFKFLAQQQIDPSVLDQAFRGFYEGIMDAAEVKFPEFSFRDYGCTADGSMVTVKRFRDSSMLAAMEEILMLQRCQHPNIVRLLDVCSVGDALRVLHSRSLDRVTHPHTCSVLKSRSEPSNAGI